MPPSDAAPDAGARPPESPRAMFPMGEDAPAGDPVELLLEAVVEDPEPQPLQYTQALRGRCAIVTGGASGIGRAVALEFAQHGVHVAFNYLTDAGGDDAGDAERTAREIAQLEVRVHYERCDVRDPQAVEGFVKRAQAALGGLHILVNNAGTARDGALWRLSDEDWASVIDTNLTGAFHMIREIAPIFRAQSDGKIVNVASIHAVRGEFGLANFSASKAGLIALTRSAALELGPSNVNVNAVAPGYIRTPRLTNALPAEMLDRAREKAVLGRLGDPQDVANVVLFLCCEYARHITGAVIPVDGGYML